MAGSDDGIEADELGSLRMGLRIMALHRLGDAEAAEEAAQESIARLIVALRQRRLDDPEKLGPFARSIAYHVVIDMLRARARHRPLGAAEEELAVASPDPLASLISAQEAERIRAALESLSGPDRELIRLSFVEGLTPTQLAFRLASPPARIRKRKQRALERLRSAFLSGAGHATPASPTE
jgi:RNA polymerase sigma factor (sigma-70 family)